MLVKTEVIVLRSMKYRDTSKIVTFYSKEYGKIKGIAKGARSAKNKFGSALEPLSHSMLLVYKKEHRDLHLISQCDSINPFKNLTEDLDRMAAALSVLELADHVTHHEEKNSALFLLLIEVLNALNESTGNFIAYSYAFQLRLAALFGYAPNFETCSRCGKNVPAGNNEKQATFQITSGAVLCSECHEPPGLPEYGGGRSTAFMPLSVKGLRLLRCLFGNQLSSLENLDYNAHTGNETGELIRLYIKYHFDEIKSLKSEKFFQQHVSTI
jgi:DNA repair protein RecO (recombination protein O)